MSFSGYLHSFTYILCVVTYISLFLFYLYTQTKRKINAYMNGPETIVSSPLYSSKLDAFEACRYQAIYVFKGWGSTTKTCSCSPTLFLLCLGKEKKPLMGAWNCNFPSFLKIMTDRLIDQLTNMKTNREIRLTIRAKILCSLVTVLLAFTHAEDLFN